MEKGDYGDTRIWIDTDGYSDKQVGVVFHSHWKRNDCQLCTDEERKLLAEGLTYGKNLFKKRLDSYLKRWGTSKIHPWSYWADA